MRIVLIILLENWREIIFGNLVKTYGQHAFRRGSNVLSAPLKTIGIIQGWTARTGRELVERWNYKGANQLSLEGSGKAGKNLRVQEVKLL